MPIPHFSVTLSLLPPPLSLSPEKCFPRQKEAEQAREIALALTSCPVPRCEVQGWLRQLTNVARLSTGCPVRRCKSEEEFFHQDLTFDKSLHFS